MNRKIKGYAVHIGLIKHGLSSISDRNAVEFVDCQIYHRRFFSCHSISPQNLLFEDVAFKLFFICLSNFAVILFPTVCFIMGFKFCSFNGGAK